MSYATLALLLLLLLRGEAPRAEACGGPDDGDFSGLQPVVATVQDLAFPDPWSDWGNARRASLRFLFPFRQADPATFEGLWSFAHGSGTGGPAFDLSTSEFDAALESTDWARAARAALDEIDAIYHLPPVPAAAHRERLDLALEVVDLAPHLTSLAPEEGRAYFAGRPVSSDTLRRARAAREDPAKVAPSPSHPRAAWLEWRAMRKRFADEVPHGWRSAIRRQVATATWASMRAEHRSWLQRHGSHPLADQVRLDTVRVGYFSGDTSSSWRLLVDLLPHRPVRALAEMRYLLLQRELPPDHVVDGLTHPLLVTALSTTVPLPPRRWNRWWELAERGGSSRWATNLQERLLYRAASRGGPLPASFPRGSGRAPTPLWGVLRAAALARGGHLAEAQRQLAALPGDAPGRARLRARTFLDQGRPVAAAGVPRLPADTRRLLLRTVLDDARLAPLTTRRDAVGADARLDLALRYVARGRWVAAAKQIEADDPAKADLWRQAGALATDHLALADLLVEHRATVFDGHRHGFYRGLSYRHRQAAPHERRAIARYLTRASPDWLALLSYTHWLERHRDDLRAAEVLKRADAAYNRLINRGGGDHFFWGRFAPRHPRVQALRRVGAQIRARVP